MKIKDVIATLERFAPLPLQDSYDNAGLQVGLTEEEVSGVLLCLDVTEDVIQEAVCNKYNLIVAHHPLLFHPTKCISDQNLVQRCIRKAIIHGITIYAAHTNLDNAPQGVNYKIAEKIGLTDLEFLRPLPNDDGGSGLIGTLTECMDAHRFLQMLKQRFNVGCLRHNACLGHPIKRVALCGGAGDFLLDDAIHHQADAFVTGEMHYHQYFGWDNRIQIAVMGHYESEQYTCELFGDILSAQHPDLSWKITTIHTNPINYM